MQKTFPLTILKEDESIKGYKRKCLAQYFDQPTASKKQKLSHSPNCDTVVWDKEAVLKDLRQAEALKQNVTWLVFARDNGIMKKNGGHIVKEFGIKNGIDTALLDKKESV